MSRGVDMDSVVVSSRNEQFRIGDVVRLFRPSRDGGKGWTTLRLFGPVYSNASFWVKSKRGADAKVFIQPCRCFDPQTCQVVSDKFDPWYDEYRRELDENVEQKNRLLQYSQYFYMCAILRKEQDNEPRKNRLTEEEKETGYKDMDSDSWTPVVVVQLTKALFKKIQNMKEDNVVKLKSGTRKAYNVNDEKYGRDIMIKYDDSTGVAPSERYQVKLVVDGGRSPLTDVEKSYLKFDLEKIYPPEESEQEVKRNFASWAKRIGLVETSNKNEDPEEDEDDDDDFEEEEAPKKVTKKSKKSEPEESSDDDDDFDDDDESSDTDDDDDDFDDEEKPKKSKKSVHKEDDDEESSDDDFDDEEEKPKKVKKSSKKSRKSYDDEEDF